jgi:hypothetical protein
VLGLTGYDPKTLDFDTIQANFDKAVAAGEMKSSDTGWHGGKVRNLLEWRGGNCIHVHPEQSADDSAGRTAMELEARRVMMRLVRFFRTQPGMEEFTIGWFAPECGVRETVVIQGRSCITVDDYTSGRLWPDAVSYSFYSVDVHKPEGLDYRPLPRGVYPTIPFSAMLPVRGRNILAAGRCICGDRLAFSAYRVQASSMAIGQAAGAAGALATQAGSDVADVPIEDIRQLLAEHDAIVPPALHE